MKTVSRLAVASTLAFLLSLSVIAGEMHTTITDPPPPGITAQTTQTNEATSQPGTDTGTPSDPVTEAILATLPTLLAAL